MVLVLIAISAQWQCERLVALNTSTKPLKSCPKSILGTLSCMTPQGYVDGMECSSMHAASPFILVRVKTIKGD